ncbi:hypothetical protein F1B92_04185 [Campylobacter sp. FMV-PI01]|uniref:CN hydrolase domain-containing protein n=1 Tax=Campylobacter portucalensis TaxID=2608384 RepID=A0A6L5WHL2_9BACT|nr:nitrilase-related carbon-nitrogen hydrolase [Campylobacter portucalensis]MSN96386.1 hypothetical protein [Campylobacter portucalensis]
MAGVLSIQINSVVGDKEANLSKVDNLIKQNSDKKLDLVVLPEFFSTNISHFDFQNSPENENGGDVIKRLQNLAKKYNTNIISGSVITQEQSKLFNTTFAIDRDGQILAKYKKIHLYNYCGGNEGALISAGDQKRVVEFDFAKVGLGICFDIRYPNFFKDLAKNGAEIFVLPTAWIMENKIFNDENLLKFERDIFNHMAQIRAFDNACFMVVSNQAKDVNSKISSIGCSMICDFDGRILAKARDEECGIFAEINLLRRRNFIKDFPIFEID